MIVTDYGGRQSRFENVSTREFLCTDGMILSVACGGGYKCSKMAYNYIQTHRGKYQCM